MTTTQIHRSPLNSLPIILMGCLIYLCFWNWSDFYYVYVHGELTGPDDFLRMSQVRAWMQGQSWFDITAYNMVPPDGGDIHWSRLVDVPIAGLIYFFDFFLDTQNATYLTAIVWPLILMLITITVWTLVCDRLLTDYLRWMPAFFGILSISSINQFSAGRVDHHNIQILCFGLIVLGLVNRDRKWGDYLIGIAVAFSISIGAETLIVLLLILAVIGLEWAIVADTNGKGILRVGIALIISSLVLYAVNFSTEDYLKISSDANSLFFLTAFILVGIAFCLLGFGGKWVSRFDGQRTVFLRLGFGAFSAGIVALVLLVVFPDQMGDPFANMSLEAKLRWLNKVSEAKSLSVVLEEFPFHWMATVGYYCFVLILGAIVLLNPKYRSTKTISLYIILFACVLGTIWQVRVIRTAAFLAVPFCTLFSMMCWNYFKLKYQEERLFLYGFQSGVVMFQISIFWYVAGALFFPLEDNSTKPVAAKASNAPAALERREPQHCMVNADFNFLRTLSKTNLVSDLTTSTAILFHTEHSVVAGPYHRNERAILDTLDFMGTDEAKAKAVADKYKLTHMGFCNGKSANSADDYGVNSITAKIIDGNIPIWLEEVSPSGEKFRVFKIRTN